MILQWWGVNSIILVSRTGLTQKAQLAARCRHASANQWRWTGNDRNMPRNKKKLRGRKMAWTRHRRHPHVSDLYFSRVVMLGLNINVFPCLCLCVFTYRIVTRKVRYWKYKVLSLAWNNTNLKIYCWFVFYGVKSLTAVVKITGANSEET